LGPGEGITLSLLVVGRQKKDSLYFSFSSHKDDGE